MPVLSNPRHETVAQRLAARDQQVTIERELGVAQGYVSKLVAKYPQVSARIAELQAKVAQKAIYTQADVLDRLAEIVELKASDFDRPREEWTPAMQRWAFDEQPIMVRSQDGKTDDKRGGWDVIGTKVRLRASDKLKALELLGKLKSVDAFVAQQQKTDVNILVVTAEKARQVQGAHRRLARLEGAVIEHDATGNGSEVIDIIPDDKHG